jgi:hypothetical protein
LPADALGTTAVDRTDAWIYGNPGFLAGTSNGRTWTRLTAWRRVGTTGCGTRGLSARRWCTRAATTGRETVNGQASGCGSPPTLPGPLRAIRVVPTLAATTITSATATTTVSA